MYLVYFTIKVYIILYYNPVAHISIALRNRESVKEKDREFIVKRIILDGFQL